MGSGKFDKSISQLGNNFEKESSSMRHTLKESPQ